MSKSLGVSVAAALASASLAFACSAGPSDDGFEVRQGASGTGGDDWIPGAGTGNGGTSGGTPPIIEGDPKTCDEARYTKSYIGCEFWPTVTANIVWDVFDFVAVVANAGETTANVEVRRGDNVIRTATVAPNGLQKIYLPWIPVLKGPQMDSCTSASGMSASVYASRGAFQLTSDAPVAVYQFSALEYQGAGGPAGKDWGACPGNLSCPSNFGPVGCFSFSNDASLLLPTTTLTGSYRFFGPHGLAGGVINIGSTLTVTATRPNTEVTLFTSGTSTILAGGRVQAMGPNQQQKFKLDQAGDVAELVAGGGLDLSGTLVMASEPVQVLAGVPCAQTPAGVQACDHLEESVFPAETLGKHYVVTRPSGPDGNPVKHVVKLYGNVNGTQLTYAGGKPAGAPSTLQAGQVVDLGRVNVDFEITGDNAFAVGCSRFRWMLPMRSRPVIPSAGHRRRVVARRGVAAERWGTTRAAARQADETAEPEPAAKVVAAGSGSCLVAGRSRGQKIESSASWGAARGWRT